jgi:hypothetical protein
MRAGKMSTYKRFYINFRTTEKRHLFSRRIAMMKNGNMGGSIVSVSESKNLCIAKEINNSS